MSETNGSVKLRGMTWNHPRGYDPLIACSALYAEKTGVTVEWEKRSLADFESYPVDELASAFDMIIIDHPHIGQVVQEGCLLPFEADSEALRALAGASVGPSFESYRWQGRHWALPIDAASQVQAFRPDRLDAPARRLEDVLPLARAGKVLLPLKAPHAIMTFFTLAANMGAPCGSVDGEFIETASGADVYEVMSELVRHIPAESFDLDPIEGLDRLASADSKEALIPYVFGYVSYARPGFRHAPLLFVDIPAVKGEKPVGAVIGGTGLAISAYCRNPQAATDFALWVTSAQVQAGPYVAGGGQPGHRSAWLSDAVNESVGGFYRNTLATLDMSYLRPRYDGYMGFQEKASLRLARGLREGERARQVIADLRSLYCQSLPQGETRIL